MSHVLDDRHLAVVDAHDTLPDLQVLLVQLLLELVVVGDSACLEAGPRPAVPASAAAPHGGAAGERRGRTTAGHSQQSQNRNPTNQGLS